jgi:hypothetical protein
MYFIPVSLWRMPVLSQPQHNYAWRPAGGTGVFYSLHNTKAGY